MNLWLIPPLTLAALAAALYLIFYWTVRRRDLVRRPVERQVGYGFKRALLIYQPSNRGAEQRHRLGAGPGPGQGGPYGDGELPLPRPPI